MSCPLRYVDPNRSLLWERGFRVVDLALNQAAKPWFHQYLDPAWYHLWRIVSENVFRGQICNLGILDTPISLLRSHPSLRTQLDHLLSFIVHALQGG